VFDGVTETVEYQLGKILTHDYHRFQVTLAPSEQAMDNTSPTNIKALEASAKAMLLEKQAELERLCKEL
jgi:hypothetical protein